MKRIVILLAAVTAVVLMSIGSVLAQPPERGERGPGGREGRGPGGPGGPDFRPPPNPIVQALDVDADGEISADEIQNAVAALKKLDKNNDGKLTRVELRPEFGPRGRGFRGPGGPGRAGAPGGGAGGLAGDPNAFIERLKGFDENKDGKITKDELPERMQAMLGRADANEDGALDQEEIKAIAERRGRGGQGGGDPNAFVERLRGFDENQDGKITKDELPERMQQILGRADTNEDGALDQGEIKAIAERFRARGGPGGRGAGDRAPRRQRPE